MDDYNDIVLKNCWDDKVLEYNLCECESFGLIPTNFHDIKVRKNLL